MHRDLSPRNPFNVLAGQAGDSSIYPMGSQTLTQLCPSLCSLSLPRATRDGQSRQVPMGTCPVSHCLPLPPRALVPCPCGCSTDTPGTAGWKIFRLPGMLLAPLPSSWLVAMQGTSLARRKIKFVIPGCLVAVGSHSSADRAGGASGWLSCCPAVPIFQGLGRAGCFPAAWHGCRF